MTNGEYYASLAHHLRDSSKVKSRQKLTQGVFLCHDKAPVYKLRLSKATLAACGFQEIEHAPYGPNLSPVTNFVSES